MKKSLTLIELLVVISIISILASFLIPSIGQARKTSKLSVDINNLKQSGLLVHMYADDNEDRYPHGQDEPLWLGKNGTIYNTGLYNIQNRPLNQYLSSSLSEDAQVKIGKCPFDNGPNGYYNYSTGGSSYAGNSNFWGDAYLGTTQFGPNGIQQSSVVNPTQFLVLSEFSIKGELWFSTDAYGVTYHSSTTTVNINEAPVLFGDGHVKKVRLPVAGVNISYGNIISASRFGGSNTTSP